MTCVHTSHTFKVMLYMWPTPACANFVVVVVVVFTKKWCQAVQTSLSNQTADCLSCVKLSEL